MKLTEASFKRRFSVNYFRNLTLSLGEMSFYKNWVCAEGRGDPYPLIEKTGDVKEISFEGTYSAEFADCGSVERLAFAYFPWATYDVSFDRLCGSVGFVLASPLGKAKITLTDDGTVKVNINGKEHTEKIDAVSSGTLSVTFRSKAVAVYYVNGKTQKFICDVKDEIFDSLCREKTMADSKIHLYLSGKRSVTVINGAKYYLSAGISQADIRPVKYEDGSPVFENGRVFLTASARCVEFNYQVVLSWCPTTCDFKLEGAVFFDCGDGYLADDVASSLIYDRRIGEWRIFMCSFSHGHIIGCGRPISDPRFGINIIDIELLPAAVGEDDRYSLCGFSGDEDPDVIYHDGKWYFAVCRLESDGYHYYHFVSEDDGESYKFLDRTEGHDKTGGSYVKADDGIYFVCGSDFKNRAVYDVYSLSDLHTPITNIKPDYDDGGFRGWGSVMMLPCGSRMKYFWITFDRHLGSHFNWSYGNIYVFESESFKPEKN